MQTLSSNENIHSSLSFQRKTLSQIPDCVYVYLNKCSCNACANKLSPYTTTKQANIKTIILILSLQAASRKSKYNQLGLEMALRFNLSANQNRCTRRVISTGETSGIYTEFYKKPLHKQPGTRQFKI